MEKKDDGKDLSPDELDRIRKEYEKLKKTEGSKWKQRLNSRGYQKFIIVMGVITLTLGVITNNVWSILIGVAVTAIAVVRLIK